MSEILDNVERISIDRDTFWLMGKSEIPINKLTDWSGKQQIFKRGEWNLFVNNVKQLQDQRSIGLDKPTNEARTLILFEESVGCQIDKNKKTIFCGKDPTKMTYL